MKKLGERAQVDMKIIYLAISLLLLGIFVKIVMPMVTGAQKGANESIKAIENETGWDLN